MLLPLRPGNWSDRFEKAWDAGADAVILDLEDAVPSESKTEARRAVAAWLSLEHPVYVRVNGTVTTWFEDDLGAIARNTHLEVIVGNKLSADA